MSSRDEYDKQMLRTLKSIAGSLEKIEKNMRPQASTPITMDGEEIDKLVTTLYDQTGEEVTTLKEDVDVKQCRNCKHWALTTNDKLCVNCYAHSNWEFGTV